MAESTQGGSCEQGSGLLPRGKRSRVVWCLCVFLAWSGTGTAGEAVPKRVLVVHSFGNAAPPFTTHSIAFETELTKCFEGKVDLDEVSLDYSRYADSEMEEALVQFVRKRQARWQADLVVPIGSPAGIFVEKYRNQLFPRTPILYTGMDRRRLSSAALQNNAAFVGERFDGPGFIEDILQLAPDTTNIVCVIGASALEQYWAAAFRDDFEQFTNRVSFTWLNHLPFDQMLERVQNLPPRSYIFLILLMRDAAGVTHNADEALKRISEVANAPINSIFEHQLGLGIMGGRLYRAEAEGVASARMAIRILDGEAASGLAPIIVAPNGPQYDWRELQRWGISENRLPPGSVVKFRQPTLWKQHQSLIITGVSILLVQSLLIGALFVTLAQRRKAERALRESEERLKLAASAAALQIWEWKFVNKNQADSHTGPRVTGNGNGNGNGNGKDSDYDRFLRSVHADDREGVILAVEKAQHGDGNYEHLHRQLLPDGQVRWIATRGRVEFDPEHKLQRMRGVAMDVTVRKAAENQARESERQFSLIANSAPVLIWVSGPDKKCTFFNEPWLEFRGRTMEQELGDSWVEGVHPHDVGYCLKTYNESFEAREPFTMEYRLQRHDGQYRWVVDHGVPRYDNQTFLGYIGSCVDISEQKELEARTQHLQQELAHVSRVATLGVIAGSLAHELKQPLTAIVCSAEGARRFMEADRMNPEEVRDALKEIAEQGQRAGEIITAVRAMFKKDPMQMRAQDVNLVVTEVLEMMRNDLVTSHVVPLLRLDPTLPRVKGDRVQLRQLVLNLVTNACEAMSDRPEGERKLTIETRRGKATEVEISVEDSGPGFPKHVLRNAFEPFHTTKAKGLGLGLAICRSIVIAHGGRVVAANNIDIGATIKFTLSESENGI